MARNKDTRDYAHDRTATRGFANLAGYASAVSYRLPGDHTVEVARTNPFTGSPDVLTSKGATPGVDIKATREGGKDIAPLLIDQALEHIRRTATALGFVAEEDPEFVPDPHVEQLADGTGYAVHLYQQFRGVPVFQMERTVQFDTDGAVTAVAGTSVSLPYDVGITPEIDVGRAARAGAKDIASPDEGAEKKDQFGQTRKASKVDASRFEPRVVAGFPLPSQPVVLDKGPFADPIPAHVVLFYMGDRARLGWYFVFTLPGYQKQYAIIVAADGKKEDGVTPLGADEGPPILYSQETSFTLGRDETRGRKPRGRATKGRASKSRPKLDLSAGESGGYEAGALESGEPSGETPSTRGKRQKKGTTTTERAAGSDKEVPARALTEGGTAVMTESTTAPAARARRYERIWGRVFTSSPGRGEREQIDFPRAYTPKDYPFDPVPAPFPDDKIPPSWWCDPVQGATIGDCTVAVKGEGMESLPGRAQGQALTFDPSPTSDEQKILNIFYFCNYMHDFFYMLGFDEESGNFQRTNYRGRGLPGDPVLARAHPAAVDGTANMMTLADGRQPLMNMGLVESVNRHTALDADVVFHEFVHGVSNRLVGGRRDARGLQQPQSRGMGEGWSDYFALTIQNYFLAEGEQEKVVTGDWVVNRTQGIRRHRYDENYPGTFGRIGQDYTEEHDIGEIWCATLMQMNRNLGRVLNSRTAGHRLGWQLVVDGMKLTPANPSFLDARDAILQALDARSQAGQLPSGAHHGVVRRAVWQAFSKFGMGPNARSVGATLHGIVEDRNLPPNV